ncbi:protein-S-isoprenylcysteine O-methyltransferase [Kwoniella mangroviensis CBS 10435]|uniref:Protein-S-isoprenylcysteine O-methyltransferase n=1 Tax=Kwoniella mangroviensis CBS 10435 TaxID=1331196 RepID=A0A1B9IR02_9TREE|nr:protein-S-isoprenylcysteine O-methyltransferase [Kwoniella mangroviensis CBS 10435]OCF74913.1 protein-S-isoprenylcysteine O-methyltransferase [Kwoniella mangroviensis CBS 8886]
MSGPVDATPIPSLSSSPTPSPEVSRLPTPAPNGHLAAPSPPTASTSPAISDMTSSTPRAGSPAPVPIQLSMPKTDQYNARGTLPNTLLAVAVIATVLGAIVGSSLSLASRRVLDLLAGSWARPQLGIYLAAVSTFHLLEFYTTAGWNPLKVSVDAFLLNNTTQYHVAHAVGLAEYFISSYFFPSKFDSKRNSTPLLAIIVIVMIGAQIIRSTAMIQAAQSFSHIVKSKKHDDHTLITHGLYSWSRHPSYTGFFYWAVFSQLLLGNVVTTIGFVVVLSRFFSRRIVDEEKWLVKFFGDEYIQYRRRVGTKLPFFFSSA